uniref:CULLIN_2 domain-containing protein n=2 Tax=Mesocestoides corti TaxID=53468 RepID=A0A5K3F4S1_MESCO
MPVSNGMPDRSGAMPEAKRFSMRILTGNNAEQDVLPDNLVEKSHVMLREAAFAVFHDKQISYTLEELFRCVEDICAQKMVPTLYETLESLFTVYVNELLPNFLNEKLDLKCVSDTWEMYCQKMLMIRSIFIFMDRKLPIVNPKYLSLWDLALNLFRENIVMHDAVQTRVLKHVLDLIRQERCGTNVDRILLRSVIRMYSVLHLYQVHFQGPFLRQSQQFYAEEGETLSKQMSVCDYLHHVDKRIVEEEDRLKAYLNVNVTRSALMSTLDTELISKRLPYLTSASPNLIEDQKLQELHLLYKLLSRIQGGVDELRVEFKRHIKQVGAEIVENPQKLPEKDKMMIQRLLSWRDVLLEIITKGFRADASFQRALQEAFEEFINHRPNKPAEFLAKYLDVQMRTGNKTQTDEELDRVMDKAMVLFRFIDGKDVFEAFYTKELAKRLLLGKSASVDAEKAMLSKLKQECGVNYTRKMETMFQDIELSRELSKNFRASQHVPYSIDFTVNVICPSSWPHYPQLIANYPPEMVALREDFTKFYLSHHQGRKLSYDSSLGTCVVRALFPSCPLGKPKELQVSEFQALVLLQFNGPEDACLSYSAIAEATAIEKTHLDRTLLSLAAGKNQRVLIMKPLTVDITPDHQFSFNTKFSHSLMRIKFNQVQLRETKEEQEETEERVLSDRVANVDCCIVRLMKARKTIEHNALIAEVFKQLHFPLKQSDVKKRIEHLIERDYMKRDSSSSSTYHYIA